MFLHRYIDPESIRIWSRDSEDCEKSYFDNYMVHRFRVEDKKLIFLYKAAIRIDLNDCNRNSTNPKKGFNLDNATIYEASTSSS